MIFSQTLSRLDATSGVAFAATMLGVQHSGPLGGTPGSRSYDERLVTLHSTHTCLIIPLIHCSKPKLSVSPSQPVGTQIPQMPMAFSSASRVTPRGLWE